jgi:predicted glycoside hydrolase/deacetylase ChbG (UPF0249 family)
MRRLLHCFAVAAALTAAAPPASRPAGRIRLIVQGDDMGIAHAVNVATVRAYQEGALRTTNVIVPAPWFLDAVEMLQANPGLDVGVHLCLTSEWSRLKWRPLTHAPGLVDSDGYFFPLVWPDKTRPAGASLKDNAPSDTEVETELRAQIEMARRHLPRVSYVSDHMGFTALRPSWRAIVQRLAAEAGLRTMDEERMVHYVNLGWRSGHAPNFDDANARVAKLIARLERLTSGVFLVLDHCGLDNAELRPLAAGGYDNVAADRDAVRAAFSDPRVMELIRRRGIELIGHNALPRPAVK